MLPATITELTELLAPFVGVRIKPARDERGNILDRLERVDIRGGGANRVDADVRSVGPDGIEVFFYNRCELIAWPKVAGITIRNTDGMGSTLARAEYYPAAMQEAA